MLFLYSHFLSSSFIFFLSVLPSSQKDIDNSSFKNSLQQLDRPAVVCVYCCALPQYYTPYCCGLPQYTATTKTKLQIIVRTRSLNWSLKMHDSCQENTIIPNCLNRIFGEPFFKRKTGRLITLSWGEGKRGHNFFKPILNSKTE